MRDGCWGEVRADAAREREGLRADVRAPRREGLARLLPHQPC
jgi:hypothetical protein